MPRFTKPFAGPVAGLSFALVACSGSPKPAFHEPVAAPESSSRHAGPEQTASLNEGSGSAPAPLAVQQATQPVVRSIRPPFVFESAVASGSKLLLLATDGRAEIRGANGQLQHAIDIGLTPAREAVPTADGWLAVGSLRQDINGREAGAVVGVRFDGAVGPTWMAPGQFASVATRGRERFAIDATGPASVLNPDGTLTPLQMPASPKAPARITFWGNELAYCTDGVRRPGADPYSTCSTTSGVSVREIWRTPPLHCGHYLVADVQADATATSGWTRVVWRESDGQRANAVPLPRTPQRLWCLGGFLLDSELPGRLLALPSLDAHGSAICSAGADLVVAGERDVWCIER